MRSVNHILSECRKLALKEYKIRHNFVGKVICWELCNKLKFDHTRDKYIYAQHRICPVEKTHTLLLDFELQTDHLILVKRSDLIIKNKGKKTNRYVDLLVPADHRVKLKESEKKDKYLDLAKELRKLWNVKVTFTPIVIGPLDAVTKGQIQGLEDLVITGRVETTQIR